MRLLSWQYSGYIWLLLGYVTIYILRKAFIDGGGGGVHHPNLQCLLVHVATSRRCGVSQLHRYQGEGVSREN